MSTFSQEAYDELKKAFADVTKKIKNYEGRRQLPTDPTERSDRIRTYCEELVTTYNNFVVYTENFYNTFDLQSQFRTNEIVEKFKAKFKLSLQILGLKSNVPDAFELMNFDSIIDISDGTENLDNSQNNQSKSNSFGEKIITSTPTTTSPAASNESNSQNQDNNLQSNSQNQNNNNLQLPAQEPVLPINTNNNRTMALSVGDILSGIPDFDPKSNDSIKKFVSQVDLMHTLSPNSGEIILPIARAKLVTANKLSSVTDRTWAQIKADIQEKYRTQVSYEVAQEKLISVQQGPKESHDAYANRVRALLDSLNGATINDNADIQNANRKMNENLAIRKFKQNIFDRELRTMALSAEHTSLADAISHAATKYEQLRASNVDKRENDKNEHERKEPENDKQNKTTYKKNNNFKYNKNKNGAHQCIHCKKTNHQSDQCIFRPGGPGYTKNNNHNQNQTQTKSSNTAAAMAQPNEQNNQNEAIATTSSVAPQQAQSMILQPYQYLNC